MNNNEKEDVNKSTGISFKRLIPYLTTEFKDELIEKNNIQSKFNISDGSAFYFRKLLTLDQKGMLDNYSKPKKEEIVKEVPVSHTQNWFKKIMKH